MKAFDVWGYVQTSACRWYGVRYCMYTYERKYVCTFVYNGVYMTHACVRKCVVKWTYMCQYKCPNMRTCTYSDNNIHLFIRVYVLMLRYTSIYERTYMHSTIYLCIYNYICNYIATDIFEYTIRFSVLYTASTISRTILFVNVKWNITVWNDEVHKFSCILLHIYWPD